MNPRDRYRFIRLEPATPDARLFREIIDGILAPSSRRTSFHLGPITGAVFGLLAGFLLF